MITEKIIKIKGLDKIIACQAKFIKQVTLTHDFLVTYKGNPSQFELLIGKDVAEAYSFTNSFNNAEFMWDSIDSMTYDMIEGRKHFKIVPNGIFSSIHLSKKKNPKLIEQVYAQILTPYKGEWWI